MKFVEFILSWVPGCSPSLPDDWKHAALQAVTCFIRLAVSITLMYFVWRVFGTLE